MGSIEGSGRKGQGRKSQKVQNTKLRPLKGFAFLQFKLYLWMSVQWQMLSEKTAKKSAFGTCLIKRVLISIKLKHSAIHRKNVQISHILYSC